MWVCNECGNNDGFRGYQEYTEWGTEGITINRDGEIVDYHDKEANDSESKNMEIQECAVCNSTNIQDKNTRDYAEWQKTHFDSSGKFIKKSDDSAKPEEFTSVDKLKSLNDRLLKNELSIEEYRQQVQEIKIV